MPNFFFLFVFVSYWYFGSIFSQLIPDNTNKDLASGSWGNPGVYWEEYIQQF